MEDIKTDEYYRVLGYVGYKNENEVSVTFCNKSGVQTSIEFETKEARKLLSPISEQPKYDPCRKFRKGDMVRVVEWNGRDIARVGEIGHVVSDEYNSRVELAIDGWKKEVYYPACHLKLITPVEELEPYIVSNDDFEYCVFDKTRKMTVCRYDICHPHAKEAAEAECARLNAEYRKEVEK